MAKFGAASLSQLATCHKDLQVLFMEVVRTLPAPYDLTILEGHRGKAAQNAAYVRGDSQKQWPDGEHNTLPSRALDAAMYPVDWDDNEACCWLAGFVFATAARLGIRIRWGGDWNQNGRSKDEKFKDQWHYELA